jgi:hypothetical protein
MQESVNLANLGLLEFRLVREVGAGQMRWKNEAFALPVVIIKGKSNYSIRV